jgi:hypothetical protein
LCLRKVALTARGEPAMRKRVWELPAIPIVANRIFGSQPHRVMYNLTGQQRNVLQSRHEAVSINL